jgi:nucleoside-diphosphate-sugar epimerase
MINGLVGHTGFVGGNLAAQRRYDATFHRPNIASISGMRFDRLVISGAPSQKWRANADPVADAAAIDGLISHLTGTRAEQAVLISTIDVYPSPRGVDEETAVEPDDHAQAYGRNRLRLEKFVQRHYPRSLVLRLPALFGPGLKKNMIYDLAQGRQEEFCHSDSTFQFYDLKRLSSDLDTAVAAGLSVLNLATEPLAAQQIATEVFGRTLTCTDVPRAAYDMHSRHAATFGARSPYLLDRNEVIAGIHAFVREGVPA